LGRSRVGNENCLGLSMLDNPCGFFRMQFEINWHDSSTGKPGSIEQLEIFNTVRHDDRDAISRADAQATLQRGSETGNSPGKFGVVSPEVFATQKRRRIWQTMRCANQPLREVHDSPRLPLSVPKI